MLSKLKSNALWVLAGLLGLAAATIRFLYQKNMQLQVKVKHGDAKLAAEKEKKYVDRAVREAQRATANRKSLVDRFRNRR